MSERAMKIEETFGLSPEEEADLEASIARADAGLLSPLAQVLQPMSETIKESSEAS